MKAGMQRPLLVCPSHSAYQKNTLVAVLGALHALYLVSVVSLLVSRYKNTIKESVFVCVCVTFPCRDVFVILCVCIKATGAAGG